MTAMQTTTPEIITPHKFVKVWRKLSANVYYRNDAQHDCSDFMLLLFEQLGISLTEFGYRESDISLPYRLLSRTISMSSQDSKINPETKNGNNNNLEVLNPYLSSVYTSLFQILQETINQKQIRTIVDDVFEGTMMTVTKCTNCDYEVKKFERFLQLSVPIVDGSGGLGEQRRQLDLVSLLRNYLNSGQYFECKKCKKKTCFQFNKIILLPEILIIQFQRLTITGPSTRSFSDHHSTTNTRTNSACNSQDNSDDSYSEYNSVNNNCNNGNNNGYTTYNSVRRKDENKITKISQIIHCDIQGFSLKEFLAEESVHLLNDKYKELISTTSSPKDKSEEDGLTNEIEFLTSKYGGYTYDLISAIEHTGHRNSGHYQSKILVNRAPQSNHKTLSNFSSNIDGIKDIGSRDLMGIARSNLVDSGSGGLQNRDNSNGSARNGGNIYGYQNNNSGYLGDNGNIKKESDTKKYSHHKNRDVLSNDNKNDFKSFDSNRSVNYGRNEMNSSSKIIENEWYMFTDKDKRKIDKNQILTPNTYLLFYKKNITQTQLKIRAKSIGDTQSTQNMRQLSTSVTSPFGKGNRERVNFDLTKRIKPGVVINYGPQNPKKLYKSLNNKNNSSAFNTLTASDTIENNTSINCGNISPQNSQFTNLNKNKQSQSPIFSSSRSKSFQYSHLITGEWLYRLHTMKYPGPINYNCFLELDDYNANSWGQVSNTSPSTVSSPSLKFSATPQTSIRKIDTEAEFDTMIGSNPSAYDFNNQRIENDINSSINPSDRFSFTAKEQKQMLQQKFIPEKLLQSGDNNRIFSTVSTQGNINSKDFIRIADYLGRNQQNIKICDSSCVNSSTNRDKKFSRLRVKYSMLHEYEFNPIKLTTLKPPYIVHEGDVDNKQLHANKNGVATMKMKEEIMETAEYYAKNSGAESKYKGSDSEDLYNKNDEQREKSAVKKEKINEDLIDEDQIIFKQTDENMKEQSESPKDQIKRIDYDMIRPIEIRDDYTDVHRKLVELKALEAILNGVPSTVYFHLPSKLSIQFPAFIPITEDQFNNLVIHYGIVGKKPLLMKDILGMKISSKQIGQAQMMILQRIEEALNNEPLDSMCAISRDWIDNFMKFINSCFTQGETDIIPPPNLTNKSLMISQDTLRNDLIPSIDYVLVPVPIFEILCKWYVARGETCYDIRCEDVRKEDGLPILTIHNRHIHADSTEGSDDELVLM